MGAEHAVHIDSEGENINVTDTITARHDRRPGSALTSHRGKVTRSAISGPTSNLNVQTKSLVSQLTDTCKTGGAEAAAQVVGFTFTAFCRVTSEDAEYMRHSKRRFWGKAKYSNVQHIL